MTIDGARIAAVQKALRAEFGPKHANRLRYIVQKAGLSAVRRARGYLPSESEMLSGFAYVNKFSGWPKANKANSRGDRRPYPRYRQSNAQKSVRTRSYRAKARRTESGGWIGGHTVALAVEMTDAAGAIYETAGKGKGTKTAAGERMISGFNKLATMGPNRYRVVLPAVIDTRPEILLEIRRQVEIAERAVAAAGRSDLWRTTR